ncbi:TIGR01906 family membrane protein [Companilactobacillus sp. DQM5]|uniref:TIGR01906 family membrane protein n=1 Tax=Companilactobacillus sp. DQM5 TaxID=3463359 RepID=UPI004059B7AC
MIDWFRVKNNSINILFVLTFSIFIIIAVSIPIYIININVIYDFSMGNVKLTREYLHLMNYLLNPFINNLKFLYFVASSSGLEHFRDVKVLFLINNIVLLLVFFIKKIFKIRLWFYKNDAISIAIVPIIIAIIASMNFDEFFILFHKLLFTNNNWLFNPLTDPIINVLPEGFFEQLIFLFLIVFEFLIYFGYRKNEKRH